MADAHANGGGEAALIERVAEEPDAVEPRLQLALQYLRDGRRADAERALEQALKTLRRLR